MKFLEIEIEGKFLKLDRKTRIQLTMESPLFAVDVIPGTYTFPFDISLLDPENAIAFDYINERQSKASLKKSYKAKLYVGGSLLMDAVAVIDSVTDKSITIRLKAATGTFKDAIGNTKIHELNYGADIDLSLDVQYDIGTGGATTLGSKSYFYINDHSEANFEVILGTYVGNVAGTTKTISTPRVNLPNGKLNIDAVLSNLSTAINTDAWAISYNFRASYYGNILEIINPNRLQTLTAGFDDGLQKGDWRHGITMYMKRFNHINNLYAFFPVYSPDFYGQENSKYFGYINYFDFGSNSNAFLRTNTTGFIKQTYYIDNFNDLYNDGSLFFDLEVQSGFISYNNKIYSKGESFKWYPQVPMKAVFPSLDYDANIATLTEEEKKQKGFLSKYKIAIGSRYDNTRATMFKIISGQATHSINTYNPGDVFMVRDTSSVFQAGGSELVFLTCDASSYYQSWAMEYFNIVPFFNAKQILKMALTQFGYTLEGNFWESNDDSKLFLFNNFALDKKTKYRGNDYNQWSPIININNHLPDATVAEFVNSIRKTCSVYIEFDHLSKTANFTYLKDILPLQDFTPVQALKGFEKNPVENSGYKVFYDFPDSDKKNTIQTPLTNSIRGTVAKVEDLTITATEDQIVLVNSCNTWYKYTKNVTESGTTYTWEFYKYNESEIIVGDGSTDSLINAYPLLPVCQTYPFSEWVDDDTSKWTIPKYSEKGSSLEYGIGFNRSKLIYIYYHGMQRRGDNYFYPYASYHNYNHLGQVVSTKSLSLNSPNNEVKSTFSTILSLLIDSDYMLIEILPTLNFFSNLNFKAKTHIIGFMMYLNSVTFDIDLQKIKSIKTKYIRT